MGIFLSDCSAHSGVGGNFCCFGGMRWLLEGMVVGLCIVAGLGMGLWRMDVVVGVHIIRL